MSAPLWTFADFLAGTGGRPIGASPEAVTGISIDSRTIGKGDAFFAIRGDAHDGHDFVGKALAAGAATAVVARAHLSALGTVRGSLVAVDDVLEALADLGRAARSRSQARIAAVTGSVGKTSTKETLARALAGEGPVHYSPASFNNHWGVPLTLARMPADSRFAVFEIGMNHPGEITPLVKMVRPHVAIVTTVEAVHLEFFRDVAEIARAKAEIFLGVEPDGAAVINRDNPHYELLADAARAAGIAHVVGFGENREAEARLEVVKLKPECSCVSANILGEEIAYKLGAPGRHLVQNSLAVLAAVSLLGGDMAKAALALAAMPAPKGRGARFALKLTHLDGYIKNPLTGRNDVSPHNNVGRLTLKYEPVSNLDVTLKYEFGDYKTWGFPQVHVAAVGPTHIQAVRYAEEPFGMREVDKQTSHNGALTANWGIGDFTLTAITGISAFRSYQNTSGSGGSPESWLSIFSEKFNQFSQEVRLLSPTGQTFEWIAGAYYDQSSYDFVPVSRYDLFGGAVAGQMHIDFAQRARSWSVFGQGTYHVMDT
ncbi:MAG: hypothetical protein J0H63_02350, partial [Rhizobiales bacterium]|nr:hypothetical protein [Hyphomicrobiales bacterium]